MTTRETAGSILETTYMTLLFYNINRSNKALMLLKCSFKIYKISIYQLHKNCIQIHYNSIFQYYVMLIIKTALVIDIV